MKLPHAEFGWCHNLGEFTTASVKHPPLPLLMITSFQDKVF